MSNTKKYVQSILEEIKKMTEIRFDELTNEHVICNPGRAGRPKNNKDISLLELKSHIALCDNSSNCPASILLHKTEKNCPFCQGNEDFCPMPELFSVLYKEERVERIFGNSMSCENHLLKERIKKEGWLLRVIPNARPILNLESRDRGISEVIIETPCHDAEFHNLSIRELVFIFEAIVARYNDLQKDHLLKYFCFFRNTEPFAGASQRHPHSQITALPIIPNEINNRVQILRDKFEKTNKCLFCEIIQKELNEEIRLVDVNEKFISFCPYASHKAFEMFVAPTAHSCSFAKFLDSPINKQHLAEILKKSIQKLQNIHGGEVPYNLLLYTAPTHYDHEHGSFHWFFKIRPALTIDAGFEYATGMKVNPVLPEEAAMQLRNIEV